MAMEIWYHLAAGLTDPPGLLSDLIAGERERDLEHLDPEEADEELTSVPR